MMSCVMGQMNSSGTMSEGVLVVIMVKGGGSGLHNDGHDVNCEISDGEQDQDHETVPRQTFEKPNTNSLCHVSVDASTTVTYYSEKHMTERKC